MGECLPFLSWFLEPRSQKKASTCCTRTALSIYLLLLTAGQGLLMYKGNATASPWAVHQRRALLGDLGARGNEHTGLTPPREREAPPTPPGKAAAAGAIPPARVCVLCICKSAPSCAPGCSRGWHMKTTSPGQTGVVFIPPGSPRCWGAALPNTHFPAGSGGEYSLYGLFVSSVFKMQREILELQEQNASYTEEILQRSSASHLALSRSSTWKDFLMGQEENWRRSLEEEITIIKSNNANLMMRMNNITLVAGMALLAGSAALVGLKTQIR